MSSGNRRHVPIAIKGLMITLQTKKGLKKKQDVTRQSAGGPTGHKTRGRDRISCSGVSFERARQLLNGMDCAVRHIYLVHHDVYTLRSFQVSRVAAEENTGSLFAPAPEGPCLKLWCACLSTISRTLQKRGLTRKKLTTRAREQDEQLRGEYLARIQQYHPRQLVFVDESSCDRRVSQRVYGWAPLGTRSRRREFFVRGAR